MANVTVLVDDGISNAIDFLEVDEDGVYVIFKDGTVEFLPWEENSKIHNYNMNKNLD